MNPELIFVPVVMQILLTLFVYIRLGQVKETAIKRGEVDLQRRGLHDDAWPADVQKVNNNIRNQFETPVLFYVLVICLWLLDAASLPAVLVAFGYVALRLTHVGVHLGDNTIRLRKRVFQASVVLLFLLCALVLLALAGYPR